MVSGREDDSGDNYEINSHRSHISAYVLVGGLVLELINALIWFKGIETFAEMAAVSLIVLGVWGEIFFGNRARIAGDKQLAQYRARAAEAEREVGRLGKKITPRVITDEQAEEIIAKVKPFAEMPFSVGTDPAAEYAFINRLIMVLQRAGWKWVQYSVAPSTLPLGAVLGFDIPESRVSGVQLRINRSKLDDFMKPAQELASALTQTLQAGVSIAANPPESPRACSPDMIHIEIYRKL
jgi:hypothetical protein